MATTTSPTLPGTGAGAPSTDSPALLLSFYDLLVIGHPSGPDAPDLAYLNDPAFETIRDPSPGSHLIVKTLCDLLASAKQRRQQKKRANGGRCESRGNRLDLYQSPYPPEYLRRLSTSDVCEELFERLEQAVRLAVLVQRSYARQHERWLDQHQALARLFVRIQACCTRLCSPTGGWFLLVCLKWLLEVLWERFFGQRVPPALKERLSYTLSEWEEELACSFLVPEALQGHVPPVPFAGAVRRWLEQMQSLARLLEQDQPAGTTGF